MKILNNFSADHVVKIEYFMMTSIVVFMIKDFVVDVRTCVISAAVIGWQKNTHA